MRLQEVAEQQRQLDALPDERECRQEEERLAAEIQGLEKAAEFHELDMKATLEKQKRTDTEVSIPYSLPELACLTSYLHDYLEGL